MSCNIVIDDFGGICLPGSTISGIVVCTFEALKEIRGVRIKLRGKEHTSWTERKSYYDSRRKKTRHRNVHHSGNNKFLAYDITLTEQGTMDPGRYEYPFTFILPRNLPDTFKGIHGYITYYIKANVDIPLALDYEQTVYFMVNSPINLNDIQSQLQLLPSVCQDEKTLWCFCCASGPITLDVHLQKDAFVVGEAAKIKIHIKNMSNESINYITLNLKDTIIYSTSSSGLTHNNTTKVLGTTSQPGVGAHGEKFYELDFIMPISSDVHNFNGSTLIKQRIFLEVEAEIQGCHINLKVLAGLVLGHIPLASPSLQQTSYNYSAVQADPVQPPPYYTLEMTPHPISNTSNTKTNASTEGIVPSAPTKAEMWPQCKDTARM